MRHPKDAPIGRVWTRVLKIVDSSMLVTTEGVTVLLRPLVGGELAPPAADLWYAMTMLTKMAKRGYVRRARPWAPGELWAVGGVGRAVLADLARPRSRRYKTDSSNRWKAKHRRDALRAERLCINGRAHGPATHGSRCLACKTTHRRTA